MLRIVSAARKS